MTARKNTVSTVQNEEKKKNSIRPLLASEIECRVGTMKPDGSGCSLLLYKDARVDMRIPVSYTHLDVYKRQVYGSLIYT